MNIVVLVKQVPDTKNIVGEAMRPDGTVNRSALPAIFNPEDLHALEMALEIKDQTGATIHAISMGPMTAMDVLRESLYRGADCAYLLSDKKFAGADTLATSYALSCAIKKIGKIDLIFAGRQAIDGDTAQVGPQIAENLSIPQITYAHSLIDINKESVTIKRNIDHGYEIVKARLPVLVTVLDTAPHLRPRDIELVINKRKTNIPVWSLEDVGADATRCGLNGSPTNVHKIANVVFSASGRDCKMIDVSQNGFDNLLNELIQVKVIKSYEDAYE